MQRTEIERKLQETIDRRGVAERALAERAERHDALSRLLYDARSARERLALRAEQVGASAQALARRIERVELELQALAQASAQDGEDPEAAASVDRIAALEAELAEIQANREREIEREIAELQGAHEQQVALWSRSRPRSLAARDAREQADAQARDARELLAAAEHSAQETRREAERVGAELAAANQFLRAHVRVGGETALSEELRVQDGYELALAAALGGRLDAALVKDVAGAEALLDRAGLDGGTALLANLEAPEARRRAARQ